MVQSALVDYDIYGADVGLREKMHSEVRQNEKLQNIRVIQRDGKVLVGEDFTPLAPTRATSAQGIRTKSELMQKRRQESVNLLQQAYGDLQKPNKNHNQNRVPARPQSVQMIQRPSS